MVCLLWKFCLNKANTRTAFVNNAMIQRMLIAAFYDADADADASPIFLFPLILNDLPLSFITFLLPPLVARLFVLMLTTSQLSTMNRAKLSIKNVKEKVLSPAAILNSSGRFVCTLLLSATVMVGVTGCGQKGVLYLADTATDSQMVTSSSEMLDSTSDPQDAAFAGLNDDDYQNQRDLEQEQVLPDGIDDPNDY